MTIAYRKLLVPTDFSEHSELAVEHAVALAKLTGASLELLAVVEPVAYLPGPTTLSVPGYSPLSLEEYGRKEATRQLEEWVAKLGRQGVTVTSHVEFGRAPHVIADRSAGFDLVVMGTHGRSGLARAFLGSVTQHVVARAHCPVLTVSKHEKK